VGDATAVIGETGDASPEGVVVDGGYAGLSEDVQVGSGRWRDVRRSVDGPLDQLGDGVPQTVEDGGVRPDVRGHALLQQRDRLIELVGLGAQIDLARAAVELVQHRVGQVPLRGLHDAVGQRLESMLEVGDVLRLTS